MNHKLTLIALLLSATLFAQEKGDVNLNAVGGLNLSFGAGGSVFEIRQEFKENKDDNSDEKYYRPFRPRAGMNAGFQLEYFVLDKLAFGTGFIYSQKGWTTVEGSKYDGNYDRTKYKTRLDYIDMPVSILVNFNGCHFYAGPVLSFLILQRTITKMKSKNEDNVEKDKDKEGAVEGDIPPRKIPAGFQFGFKKQMSNGYTYGAGFLYTPVSALADREDYNNCVLQLSIGKVFQLRNKSATTSQVSTKQNDAYVKTETVVTETKVSPSQPVKQETKVEPVNKISEEKQSANVSVSNSNASSATTAQNISEQPKQQPVIETKPVVKQNYFIDYGMANLEASAQKITDNLKSKGYDAHYYWIPDREKDYVPMYRIYIGPFDSESLANSILPKVKKMQSTATVSTSIVIK